MAEVPTFDELYDAGKAEIQSRNPQLTDFVGGSNNDAAAGSGAVLADEVVAVVVDRFADQFFATAKGDALDELAVDRLNLPRKPDAAAVGIVQWTRGSSVGGYTIPLGTNFRATVNGVSVDFASTAEVIMLGGDSVSNVSVAALVVGRGGNVAEDVVTEIVTPIPADPDATCTNPARMAGGALEEKDELYLDRIQRYYASLEKATPAAIEVAALGVAGVAFATVDESQIEQRGPTRVYIGDQDAGSNPVLEASVDAAILLVRAAGAFVVVEGGSREVVALALELTLVAGSDSEGVFTACRAGIVSYGDSLGPGDVAHISRIVAACHRASDLVVGAKVTSHGPEIFPALTHAAIRFEAVSIAFTHIEVP